jgi:hypothetical protein
VTDGVRVVLSGLLEESLEVVGRWPQLMLVVVRGYRSAPHVGAAHLPVVAVIVVGRGHSPFRTLLALPLATLDTLPGSMDHNVGWRLPVTAWCHLLAPWGKTKFGRLAVGDVLGGDTAQLLGGVPENVTVFPLARFPYSAFMSTSSVVGDAMALRALIIMARSGPPHC